MKCEIPNCRNKAIEKHYSVAFKKTLSICHGHHIAFHRLKDEVKGYDRLKGVKGGIPLQPLLDALPKKTLKELLAKWKLKMGKDGYIHAIPKEIKEKMIFS